MKTKLTMMVAMATACAAVQLTAMPTAEETRRAEPVVRKLMASERAALKSGRKTRSEVADAAMKLAAEADTEAAKLLLMKGAFVLYVQDGKLEKAVETMKTLEAAIADMPPQSVTNMIKTALLGVSRKVDGAQLYKLLDEKRSADMSNVKYKFAYKLENGKAIITDINPKPVGTVVIPDKIDGHWVTAFQKYPDTSPFAYCDNVTKVVLPAGLTDSGGISCKPLSSIEVSKANTVFASRDGVLYSKDFSTLFIYPKTRERVKLSPETRKVRACAFRGCALKTAKIPEGIEVMEPWNLCECPDLESIEFPKSLKYLGQCAAFGNPKLKKIVFNGDAPQVGLGQFTWGKQYVFTGAPEDLVIEVRKGTKGWKSPNSTELPERWPVNQKESRPIRYMKEAGSWTVAQYNSASPIPSFVEAKELVEKASKVAEQTYQTLSFENNYRRWGCFPHVEFPGTTAGENADYFAIVATGDIYVPNEGDWTFACLNDDGVRFTISGNGLSDTFENDGLGGVFRAPWLHTVHFPRAGIYSATCLFFENRGIAALEYSVARGSHSRFDSSKFKLVGDPESGIVMVGAGEDADRQVRAEHAEQGSALQRLRKRRVARQRELAAERAKLEAERPVLKEEKKGLYMVVDLTKSGKNAVTYLDEAPKDGWSDEYRTKKIALRRIEPGSFEYMPGRSFKITKPFYIGVFEVTQKQYEMTMKENPSVFKGDMRPVERVSYIDIRGAGKGLNWPKDNKVDGDSYLGKLRKRIGLEFDLPTEVQWEYACRAGTKGDFNVEGIELVKLGKCIDNGGPSDHHVKVGSFIPNAWGLYDMHGNVWEWCLDRGGRDRRVEMPWAADSKETETDPKGLAEGTSRFLRGGGCGNGEFHCRSGQRNCDPASDCGTDWGFRLACPAGAQ